ncbi:response regulator [Nodosilinea sp. LEGE 07298]|uniref:response regulator n=1 Tax=Nodosilinea sp. LEGE 07298 TaxID=2777970 RepID=UPI00187DE014|nr:response regulator [Nodosilinea sp. LEGE 07298]MBE9107955.1 response regulator [Nodosilinea sp. LEGE 07298]
MTLSSTVSLAPQHPMLVVEDSDEDFEAIQRFVRRSPISIPVQRCVTGEQALAQLSQTVLTDGPTAAQYPGLIVLDLNLPGTDGRDVLRQIKQDATLKTIPVIIFTTSNNPQDIQDCYHLGVRRYIVKPIDYDQLKRDIQSLIDYWFEVTHRPESPEPSS